VATCADCGSNFDGPDGDVCPDCLAPACGHCGADYDRDGEPTCSCTTEEG
jgi:hypothetical protein